MILSSADILRKLGSDAIVRQCALLSIVDGKPGFGTDEYVYIYVDRYPEVLEFEATWKIWILDGGSDLSELVLNTIVALLPGFRKEGSYYTTTDFATSRTVVKSEAAIQIEQLEADRKAIKKGFKGLSESVEGRLKGVRDGIDGVDGKDGPTGATGARGERGTPGRDGRDLVATEANLDDLQDVEMGLAMKKGQVLTWDGSQWTNLYIPQIIATVGGGNSGGGGGGIAEAPNDGEAYLRQSQGWVPNTSVPVDISNNALDDLSDVSTAAPSAGEALIYDGSQWRPGGDLAGGSF